MNYGKVHSPYLIDTQPGSGGAMAPWHGFKSGFNEYRDEIRQRFKKDPEARRHMLIAAQSMKPGCADSPVRFRGRYAWWARSILTTLRNHLHKDDAA
jgi:hypothetical protein